MAVSRAAAIKIVNTRFSACNVAGASSVSVVSGGAGFCAVLVPSVSLTGCLLNGAGGQDLSGTSAGLLVLSSSAAPTQIAIDACSFSSTGTVSLNVTCVDAATGFNSVACLQPGPAVSASNSNISQLYPPFSDSNFLSIGSSMMSLQQNVILKSSNTFIVRYSFPISNSTQFAVFKKSLENVVYSCSPCLYFEFARTSNIALLDTASTAPSIDKCLKASSTLFCPFGVDFCTTILNVTSGFWTGFTESGDQLNDVSRCPQGYCGCGSESCLLHPPLSPYYRPDDALCNSNRTGVLCGGCKKNFTQSLDGVTCISNDECANNVGWTWAVTVIGYAVYAAYTVLTSLQVEEDNGLITCMLFYGQMSLFASYQRLQTSFSDASQSSSAASSWAARITQFESVTSLYSRTCYGRDMGAYTFTATQLSGPAIVLVLSLAITMMLKRAQLFMQRHEINVKISVSATLSTVTLLLFSSVTTIIFKLITCNDKLHVIFIDGTEPCQDAKWKGLVAVVVILSLFPVLFAAALRWKHLPPEVRITVCSAFLESHYYWGAVTLTFRLVMSIVYARVREFPSIAALVQSILCVAMLLLLTYQRPYRLASTYHFDVLCYVCLIIQFVLEVLVRSSESLGISPGPGNLFYPSLESSYTAGVYLRCVRAESLLFVALPSFNATHAAGTFRSWPALQSGCISNAQLSPKKHLLCIAPSKVLRLPASNT